MSTAKRLSVTISDDQSYNSPAFFYTNIIWNDTKKKIYCFVMDFFSTRVIKLNNTSIEAKPYITWLAQQNKTSIPFT